MLGDAIAALLAGPLADRIFEPVMQTQGKLAPLFSPILGIDPGAGMALLYEFCSLCVALLGSGGFL